MEVYWFDGTWYYSKSGQLRPLPEGIETREEAIEAAKKEESRKDEN